MGKFYIIGHRGYGPTHFSGASPSLNRQTPENSLAAFKHALDNGAHGIELDVKITKDGTVIVLHDRHIQNHVVDSSLVTNRDLDTLDYADIRHLDIGGGHRIPKLQEVLELAATYTQGLYINLDVKDSEAVIPVLDLLEADSSLNSRHQIMLSSYDWDLLRMFRRKSPNATLIPAIQTTLLFGAENVKMPGFIPMSDTYDPNARRLLKELNSEINIAALDCTFTDLKSELVAWAQEMGIGLQISTGNKRIVATDTNYQALSFLYETTRKYKGIPFVTCKVDEPDKVIRTFEAKIKPSKDRLAGLQN